MAPLKQCVGVLDLERLGLMFHSGGRVKDQEIWWTRVLPAMECRCIDGALDGT